jgi:hypothetical protein
MPNEEPELPPIKKGVTQSTKKPKKAKSKK